MLSPCCASVLCVSLYLLCFIANVLFSSFIILFWWLDSVKLHYVYLKSHQVSQTVWVFSILNPSEEYRPCPSLLLFERLSPIIRALLLNINRNNNKADSLQKLWSTLLTFINISVSKNGSVILQLMVMLMVLYCYPIYLSYKEMYS